MTDPQQTMDASGNTDDASSDKNGAAPKRAPQRPAAAHPPARSRLRLTPEEFKAEVWRRGWTYRALAERWEVSENWVSKLARNTDRPLHWDDAVRGLPMVITQTK